MGGLLRMHFNVIFACFICSASGIWPPEYKVNLKHEEEFIISELLDESDVRDVYDEEEMIKKEDLEAFHLQAIHSEKYFRLHNQVKRKDTLTNNKADDLRRYVDKFENMPKTIREFNPEDEPKPWIGGIEDKNNNYKKDEGIFYFDDEAKSNKTKSEKLQKRNATVDVDYNYENLKEQFHEEVKKAEHQSDTLKYKEVKEDESPKEAVKTLVDFTPRNCTEEEKTGIGFAAIKCFWIEARNKKLNKNKREYIMKKVLLIILLWVLVYVAIALPLWCQYGWCCCCCRCKFCQPRNQIDEIKTFFANNPPGVYHDGDGVLSEYKPTVYEIYAQKALEKEFRRL